MRRGSREEGQSGGGAVGRRGSREEGQSGGGAVGRMGSREEGEYISLFPFM